MNDPLIDVSRETIAKLERYRDLLVAENDRHNLVSGSTIPEFWQRHIIDSAQLAALGPAGTSWCDVGSGAGLPGVVVACLVPSPVRMIEPRRLRADFLLRAIDALGLVNASVDCLKAERAIGRFDVITGRAVAPLGRLLGMARHLAHSETLWVLPKGRNAQSELAEARLNWHCEVREVPSLTDPEATILVLRDVEAKR